MSRPCHQPCWTDLELAIRLRDQVRKAIDREDDRAMCELNRLTMGVERRLVPDHWAAYSAWLSWEDVKAREDAGIRKMFGIGGGA